MRGTTATAKATPVETASSAWLRAARAGLAPGTGAGGRSWWPESAPGNGSCSSSRERQCWKLVCLRRDPRWLGHVVASSALPVLPGQKFANGLSGVKIWPEMGRFRFYKWPTKWPAFCPLFCPKMVQFGAKRCLGNVLRHKKNQYPY